MSKSSTAGANISSSSSSHDLIDAKLEEHQLCAGSKQCPGCGHRLETKPDWVGLPAGVKFDPTDQELIEHLEAKVEAKDNIRSHPLIDEFIPTIEGEDGICYTHPEKLPGVTRDGLSRHFFHRPSKAYTTGTRKRRKIQTECDLQSLGSEGGGGGGETRWHKTGKTRPVMVNGKQKGCKKILVLYTNFGKNRKPEKTNWVMHQYHLGVQEEEKAGELVVSKIFYQTQPRQCNWSDRSGAAAISITTGEAGSSTHDHNYSRRDSTGSGSCSSSKEIVNTSNPQRSDVDQIHGTLGVVGAAISSYNAMDIQQFKPDHFGFPPFRKSFDEVEIGEASTARDAPGIPGACDEQQQRQHHQIAPHDHHHGHHQMATTAFHITTPSHPISTIISPPPALHHTASLILDQADPYHVSRLMLQNEIQQQQQQHHHHHQQQQEQQHHKLGGRSASGLEELIMGCTSTTSNDHLKEVATIANTQEAEWLKYSTFWQDPDNQDHHHHG